MSKPRVLVAIPIRKNLHPYLRSNCIEHAAELPEANPDLDVVIHLDYSVIPPEPGDCRPWSKVTRIRNWVVDSVDINAFSHICWLDADVVEYPRDILTTLIDCNETGVSAPLVLIEQTDKFYDWAAFIMKGKSKIEPANRNRLWGRNLQHPKPYFWEHGGPTPDRDPMNPPPGGKVVDNLEDVMEMDCVGTMYVMNTEIYKTGIRHEDHPAFTDHFPICKKSIQMKRPVTVNRTVAAYHAVLPNYGEAWH